MRPLNMHSRLHQSFDVCSPAQHIRTNIRTSYFEWSDCCLIHNLYCLSTLDIVKLLLISFSWFLLGRNWQYFGF